MQVQEMQRIMLDCQKWELGVHASNTKKTARIALCSTVQLYAACFQLRSDAHQCLDLAFDRAQGGQSVSSAMAATLGALAVVGNAHGVSLEAATVIVPRVTKPLWLQWRDA